MNKKSLKWLKSLYVIGGIMIVGVLWFSIAKPLVVLPRSRLAPGYLLSDAQGQNITSEDGRGKLTIYTFAYLSCRQACDHIYQTLSDLDRSLAAQSPSQPIRYITITVDPQHDLPGQLLNFPPPFIPIAAEWLWLSGEPAVISQVVRDGFGVFFAEKDGKIAFSPKFILVDGWGIIRSEYDASLASSDILLRDISLVLKEIEQSKGTARLAYEAAHFFACYP